MNEDRHEELRFRKFIREHREVAGCLAHMPAFIHGVGGKRIPTLDATYLDFQAYQKMLESRIRRNSPKA